MTKYAWDKIPVGKDGTKQGFVIAEQDFKKAIIDERVQDFMGGKVKEVEIAGISKPTVTKKEEPKDEPEMTRKEIMAVLDGRGITYRKNTSTKKLIEMMEVSDENTE